MIRRLRLSKELSLRSQVVSNVVAWVSVGLVAAIVVQPLLGAPPRGADTLLHLYRIPIINSFLQQGVLYSRWEPDLVWGYGYPLFNFYPPLSAYWLTASYWLASENALVGWNLASGLILIVTVLGMYQLGCRLFGRTGGVFAAAAYALSPHVLYQTFQRGSISNALTLAIAPFALLALIDIAQLPRMRSWIAAALGIAAIFLSHISTSALVMVPLAVLGLSTALGQPGDTKSKAARIGAVGSAVATGLALSAFTWLPALSEISFTQYDATVSGVDFSSFFADLLKWPAPAIDGLANPDLPYSLGVGQLVLGCIGIGLAANAWLSHRRSRRPDSDRVAVLVVLSGSMALVATFVATSPSAWLWKNLPIMRNFQFPMRWLDVGAFLLPLTCGWLVCQSTTRSWWRIGIGGLGLAIFFANGLPYVYPLRWQTGLPPQPTLEDATRQAQVQYGIYGLTAWGEYMPSAVNPWPSAPPFPGAELGATLDRKLVRSGLPAGSLIQASGDATNATLRLRLSEATTLAFYTFYFPGWAADIDGKAVPLGPDTLGRLTVAVPAGAHTLSVHFGETPLRLLSDGISIIATVLIGLMWLFSRLIFSPFRAAVGTPQTQPDMLEQPRERRSGTPMGVDAAALVMCGVLLASALGKFVWLDHFESPWVHHLQNEHIADTNTPEWSEFGTELKLLGYHLAPPDRLTLYWQAQQVPTRDYRVEVTLSDARGRPRARVVHDMPGHNLTSRWEKFQLVRDEYQLPLDESQRPIGYRLSVSVFDPVTQQELPLCDSPDATALSSSVGTTKLTPAPAANLAGSQSLGVVFGDSIELTRAFVPDRVSAGATLTFSLAWKSLAPVSVDYTVFVHLLNQDDTLAAAGDTQPREGLYPTSFWSPGEEITDDHYWSLSVAPGAYLLEVGLYRLDTGERLTIASRSPNIETRVILKKIQVVDAAGTARP